MASCRRESFVDLTGKKAFVTGASGGLGRHIAISLANAGCNVALGYHKGEDRVAAVAEAVSSLGQRGAPVSFDQGDDKSIEAGVQLAVDALDGVDILINNAAIVKGVPFKDLDTLGPEIWDDTMRYNLRGPWLVSRAAAPHLANSGAGRIVNVAAMAGMRPMGASIAQSISKAGVIQMTRCLAVALAPNVTVNCVAPGLMEGTVMTQGLTPEFRDAFASQAVLGTTTSLQDVASQVVQFCQSETITGQTTVIDGGIYFH